MELLGLIAGSKSTGILNFDRDCQIALHRGYTNITPSNNMWDCFSILFSINDFPGLGRSRVPRTTQSWENRNGWPPYIVLSILKVFLSIWKRIDSIVLWLKNKQTSKLSVLKKQSLYLIQAKFRGLPKEVVLFPGTSSVMALSCWLQLPWRLFRFISRSKQVTGPCFKALPICSEVESWIFMSSSNSHCNEYDR